MIKKAMMVVAAAFWGVSASAAALPVGEYAGTRRIFGETKSYEAKLSIRGEGAYQTVDYNGMVFEVVPGPDMLLMAKGPQVTGEGACLGLPAGLVCSIGLRPQGSNLVYLTATMIFNGSLVTAMINNASRSIWMKDVLTRQR